MITHHQFIDLMPGQFVVDNHNKKKIVDVRQSHGITLEIGLDTGEWVSADSLERLSELKLQVFNSYDYLDAMNDLAGIQFIDNTIDEAEEAKAEVIKIIKGLCGARIL